MAKVLLSDLKISKKRFHELDAVFKKMKTKEFLRMSDRKRSEKVNKVLCDLVDKESEPCFLLPAVLEFIERAEKEKILDHYTFNSFELWLNQYSDLSFEENCRIRGKIAGKWVPRSEYEKFFPIGMGKIYEGSHFVTAHRSPDLDTTVASFWGWIDAMAARVGNGLHIWNLPGGPPPSLIEVDLMFKEPFGNAVFTNLMKSRSALNLVGNDLMTQKGLVRISLDDAISSIDHERDHKSFIIVDGEGFYLGDWRSIDVEGVRQVILLLNSTILWFENQLHLNLISLFAAKDLHFKNVGPKLKHLFAKKVKDSEPVMATTAKQRKHTGDFIVRVLGIKSGLECSFEELAEHMAAFGGIDFEGVGQIGKAVKELFDKKGSLVEKRSDIFRFLQKIIEHLHEASSLIRQRLEKIDIALKTKTEVFAHKPTFVTVRSDVDEIKNKMGSYQTLTVAYPDDGKFFPVGTIYASDLRKPVLGTVSLRDFCNPEEMTIPSYMEVISVIDHHKTQLNTYTAPMALIADVQSSNTLVAFLSFEINDRYGVKGILAKKPYFIAPDREISEYLHFLYAILNDTDLLSKTSVQDLECVAELLNRLKTLQNKKKTALIELDDLSRNQDFLKIASQRILQNEDMYSLYRKVYMHKEEEEEKDLALCAKGKPSGVFSDTKEQNGCCRVGQTKLFASNISSFHKNADAIRKAWLESAKAAHKEKPDLILHLQMISTIVSAEEVYKGKKANYSHKDELWIWAPEGELGIEFLTRFLVNFKNCPGFENSHLEVEFLGSNASNLSLIFKEGFFDIPQKTKNKKLPIAVLRFKPGSLNSRKAMVTPFLPTVST